MSLSPRLKMVVLAAGLLLICGLLSMVIVNQLDDQEAGRGDAAVEPANALTEQAAPELPEFDLPPLTEYATLMERPLFSSTRRPIVVEGNSAQAPVTQQGLDVALTGVIIADESKVALIVPRNGVKPLRLSEGESYQGWTLSEVEAEGVIFRQGGRAQILELNHKPGGSGANQLTRQPQQPAGQGQKS